MKRAFLCLTLAVFFWSWTILRDRLILNENVIRLHVVANSDDEKDQNIKLQVRDAVIASIQKDLENVSDISAAKEYLNRNLSRIKAAAEETLEKFGFDYDVAVTLCKEAFDTRVYDTFTLPAGVYEALRVTIGEGTGKNWWCVVFPSLCIPATTEGVASTAAGAGFSDTLSQALTEERSYKVRFYLLDKLGQWENMFFDE